jgi:hypothetical protein
MIGHGDEQEQEEQAEEKDASETAPPVNAAADDVLQAFERAARAESGQSASDVTGLELQRVLLDSASDDPDDAFRSALTGAMGVTEAAGAAARIRMPLTTHTGRARLEQLRPSSLYACRMRLITASGAGAWSRWSDPAATRDRAERPPTQPAEPPGIVALQSLLKDPHTFGVTALPAMGSAGLEADASQTKQAPAMGSAGATALLEAAASSWVPVVVAWGPSRVRTDPVVSYRVSVRLLAPAEGADAAAAASVGSPYAVPGPTGAHDTAAVAGPAEPLAGLGALTGSDAAWLRGLQAALPGVNCRALGRATTGADPARWTRVQESSERCAVLWGAASESLVSPKHGSAASAEGSVARQAWLGVAVEAIDSAGRASVAAAAALELVGAGQQAAAAICLQRGLVRDPDTAELKAAAVERAEAEGLARLAEAERAEAKADAFARSARAIRAKHKEKQKKKKHNSAKAAAGQGRGTAVAGAVIIVMIGVLLALFWGDLVAFVESALA